MITIIDYGMGNIGSIQNMLKKIGVDSLISSDSNCIANAQKLILPGVGAFNKGMDNLCNSGLTSALNDAVLERKVPILGICLGMQLMTNSSEEGECDKGLGWINADTIKFQFNDNSLKVPHMGWNTVAVRKQSRLFSDATGEQKFYFVHSYFVKLNRQEDELTSTNYGRGFTSAFERDNIYGVQFHPEKSHKYGMSLLFNFALL